jgi:hypothetical protein
LQINLRFGLKSPNLESSRETCTACAGTMILEMAALSRLTGESVFEVQIIFINYVYCFSGDNSKVLESLMSDQAIR